MKCNLNFLQQNNISYYWNTLFIGLKLDLINSSQIANYAMQYLAEHHTETNQFIVELASIKDTTFSVDKLLEHLIENCTPGTSEWNKEERKLRFCLLLDLQKNILDAELLLEKIAEVYAKFDYPPDMEEFIYYMSAKNYDPSQYSITDNRQRLLILFNAFLHKEKNDISFR